MFENFATPNTPPPPPTHTSSYQKPSYGGQGHKPPTGSIQRKPIESCPSWIAFGDPDKEAEQVIGTNPTLSRDVQWFLQAIKNKERMKLRMSVTSGIKDFAPREKTEFFTPWKDFGQDGEYDKYTPVQMSDAACEIAALFKPEIASIEKPGSRKLKSSFAHALFGRYGKERAAIVVVILKTTTSCLKLSNPLTYRESGSSADLANAGYYFDFPVYNLNSTVDVEYLKNFLER